MEGLSDDTEAKEGIAKVVGKLLKEQSERGAGEMQGRAEQLRFLLEVGGEGRFRRASGNVALGY